MSLHASHSRLSLLTQLRLCRAVDADESLQGTVTPEEYYPSYWLDSTTGRYLLHTTDFRAYVEAVQLVERLRREGTAALRREIAEGRRRAQEREYARCQRLREHRRRVFAKFLSREEAA